MSQPSNFPDWATNTDYTGTGTSLDGTPTQIQPTSGRVQNGWVPGFKIGGQGLNWLLGLIGVWVRYLLTFCQDLATFIVGTQTITRNRMPSVIASAGSGGSGWSNVSSGTISRCPSIQASSGSSIAEGQLDLDVPDGYVLTTLKISGLGPGGISFSVFQEGPAGWVPAITGSKPVGWTGGFGGSSEADHEWNFVAETGPTSTGFSGFTAQASGGGGLLPITVTFSRSTGSFITDGFAGGQKCDSSGWNLAENNFSGYSVQSVSALSLALISPGSGGTIVGTVDTGTPARQVEATPIVGQGGTTLLSFSNSSGTGGEAFTCIRTTIVPFSGFTAP